MRHAYLQGIKTGLLQWRITASVYLIQLGLSLTLGIQIYEVLQASIGHSLEINKLMHGYDHTVLTDFLKVHGASITPLLGQIRWLLLLWLLFSVFINGGLLYCAAEPRQASVRLFWQGGAVYFWPFLKIGLFFLLLALAWTLLIWLPVALVIQPSLEYFSSEKYTVWLVLIALIVWLSGLGILLLWSVLSRLQRLEYGMPIAKSLAGGWRIFRQNKLRFLILLALFTGMQVLLVTVYFLIQSYSGMTSPFLIVLFFLIQQGFVFFRIQLRQMLYAALHVASFGENPPSAS
ncbi:MAG: hypothetical protein H6569_05465 [Lewinellaceae bacterium]|nr:hypothetical protein [Lewinellaceae bacterium]